MERAQRTPFAKELLVDQYTGSKIAIEAKLSCHSCHDLHMITAT